MVLIDREVSGAARCNVTSRPRKAGEDGVGVVASLVTAGPVGKRDAHRGWLVARCRSLDELRPTPQELRPERGFLALTTLPVSVSTSAYAAVADETAFGHLGCASRSPCIDLTGNRDSPLTVPTGSLIAGSPPVSTASIVARRAVGEQAFGNRPALALDAIVTFPDAGVRHGDQKRDKVGVMWRINRQSFRAQPFVALVVMVVVGSAAYPMAAAGAHRPATPRAQSVFATYTVRGSVEQVDVTGTPPLISLDLVDRRGHRVDSQIAGSLGGVVFRNVRPGDGYRVRQGLGRARSVRLSDRVVETLEPAQHTSTTNRSRRAATAT